MIWRLALLVVVIGAAWLVVALWERRPVRSARPMVTGLTLVTGADCALCSQALTALGDAGIPVSIVDVGDAADPTIRSIPTAFVADAGGRVIARRSGRSVITAMPELITLARSVA
jgi:hypothetical protein